MPATRDRLNDVPKKVREALDARLPGRLMADATIVLGPKEYVENLKSLGYLK